MNFKTLAVVCFIILVAVACNQHKQEMIFPQGEKIPNDNFTGTAYLQMLMEADSINPTTVGNVTFEPGARTKWHLHPGGQIDNTAQRGCGEMSSERAALAWGKCRHWFCAGGHHQSSPWCYSLVT